jgi:RimJ/RimL family protein N-acetyltransferase
VKLVPILDGGEPETAAALSPHAAGALKDTAALYARAGYAPPWISYLGVESGVAVGICAFVGAPKGGEVEIAYHTFPENEGRGIATGMASELIAIAAKADALVNLKAHTPCEENASTAILRKLGFSLEGVHQHPEDGPVWLWRRRASISGA